MAAIHRRITHQPPANQQTLLYTVPAGKVVVLRNLVLSQNNTAGVDTCGLILNGAGFVWDTQTPDEYSSGLYQLGTFMTAGETLHSAHSVPLGYTAVSLVEMDPADAPTGHRVTMTNIQQGGNNTWVCPAGKKFRCRELVIAPHATSADINIYIGGIGYLLRTRVTAYQPIVQSLDFTVYAGETLGGAAGGGVIHAFFSGVLEDI